MNPDKCSPGLHLKPCREEILQPFQAMQLIAPLSLPCKKKNSEYAAKIITFYLIHLNMKILSLLSKAVFFFLKTSSHPPSTLPLLFMLSYCSSDENIMFSSPWTALVLPQTCLFFFSCSTPLLKYSTHNFHFLSTEHQFHQQTMLISKQGKYQESDKLYI